MNRAISNSSRTPVGQIALHHTIAPHLPEPAVQSFIVAGARHTHTTPELIHESYPVSYATDGSLRENLRFALKYEPLDLRILSATLKAIGAESLENWVREEPTGAFSRRAWFFYEWFTGETLDLPSLQTGNYVEALNPALHFVGSSRNSPRHRVRNNLLGVPDLCPVVRKTPKLEAWIEQDLKQEAQTLTKHYSSEALARAVSFLYTEETRSSFAIEGESPSRSRIERFLQVLHRVADFDPTEKASLLDLQNRIVDPRYAATDWRDLQNFVGKSTRHFGENIVFVCPRPEDVPGLMTGWTEMTRNFIRLSTASENALDPVIAAAVSAFAFVFIHPFEDGNGRIHRFLVHSMLAKRGYTPPGVIFPISAAILRNRDLYRQALNAFSGTIMSAIEWEFIEDSAIRVNNETRDLYRFFDATPQVEYLFERVAETIRIDLAGELEFLETYDRAFIAVQNIVDMPDRRLSLLLRYCLQNEGRLSQNKRKQFSELTDEEIAQIESAISGVLSKTDAS